MAWPAALGRCVWASCPLTPEATACASRRCLRVRTCSRPQPCLLARRSELVRHRQPTLIRSARALAPAERRGPGHSCLERGGARCARARRHATCSLATRPPAEHLWPCHPGKRLDREAGFRPLTCVCYASERKRSALRRRPARPAAWTTARRREPGSTAERQGRELRETHVHVRPVEQLREAFYCRVIRVEPRQRLREECKHQSIDALHAGSARPHERVPVVADTMNERELAKPATCASHAVLSLGSTMRAESPPLPSSMRRSQQ